MQFADRADSVTESPPAKSVPPLRRQTLFNPETRRRSIQWHQPFRCVRFAEIDLDFGFETRADHSIDLDDPGSAATRIEHRLHFKRGTWRVEIISVAELTATPATYNPRGTLEVRENGEPVFRREWAPLIPRTCS